MTVRTDKFQVGDEVEFKTPQTSCGAFMALLGPKPWVVSEIRNPGSTEIEAAAGHTQFVIVNGHQFSGFHFKPIERSKKPRTDTYQVGDRVEFDPSEGGNFKRWAEELGPKPWFVTKVVNEPHGIHSQLITINHKADTFSGGWFKPIIQDEVYQIGDRVDLKPGAPPWLPRCFGNRPWVVTDITFLSASETQNTTHSQQLDINGYCGVSGSHFRLIGRKKPSKEALLIEAIKAALNTEEDGDNLVKVARAASRAEQELVSLKRRLELLVDEY
jgi:hypothetical protein